MGKTLQEIRVHELAKELCMPSKELVERLKAMGLPVRGHMSVLDARMAKFVRSKMPKPSPEEMAKRAEGMVKRDQRSEQRRTQRRKLAAKKKAEGDALKQAAEDVIRKKEEEEEAVRQAEIARRRAEAEAEARRLAEEEAHKQAEDDARTEQEARQQAAEDARREAEDEALGIPAGAGVLEGGVARTQAGQFGVVRAAPKTDLPVSPSVVSPRAEGAVRSPPMAPSAGWPAVGRGRGRRAPASRRRGPRTGFRRSGRTGAGRSSRRKAQTVSTPVQRPTGPVSIERPLTIRSLSAALGIQANVLQQKFLLDHNQVISPNDVIEDEFAQLLAADFDVELVVRQPVDLEQELAELEQAPTDQEALQPRPPVFTLLGHVDHGKTTLMDAIRQTNVVDTESGGITQHTSAYRVPIGERWVTFIDTPGHEAFSEMRARGASVTDIVVLVVAADDGVMPQTVEAISHAKAAEVPIVVALNKIDRDNANLERVKTQLAQHDLQPEEYGGTVGVVPVSALKKEGIGELLERIQLEAEILEFTCNPDQPARGTVLEAYISEGRGAIATVLVQDGTLRRGDVILSSHGYGRVRVMHDDSGTKILEAGPSMPVEVSGLDQVPVAGDRFYVLKSLDKARQIAARREDARRQASLTPQRRLSIENIAELLAAGQVEKLNLVVKTDVMGSVEAIKGQLLSSGTDDVKVDLLHIAVGGINESDVQLANASGAVVLGFRVGVEPSARLMAESLGVEVRLYDVIYELLDEVRKGLEGLLKPEEREIVDGHAEVRETFKISRVGTIAGCFVIDGLVTRRGRLRLTRDGVVAFDGSLETLRRFKEDVAEVRDGFEFGVKLVAFDDIKVGDVLEAYHIEQIKRTLE